jgi:hypothetical protein
MSSLHPRHARRPFIGPQYCPFQVRAHVSTTHVSTRGCRCGKREERAFSSVCCVVGVGGVWRRLSVGSSGASDTSSGVSALEARLLCPADPGEIGWGRSGSWGVGGGGVPNSASYVSLPFVTGDPPPPNTNPNLRNTTPTPHTRNTNGVSSPVLTTLIKNSPPLICIRSR